MSFLKKGFGNNEKDKMDKLIEKRDQLLTDIIPVLQEQVRNNPSDGKLHLELVKALAMGELLDEAKVESNAAMLKFPVYDRKQICDVQALIDKLIRKRDLGY